MINFQNFLKLSNLKNFNNWRDARNEYGWNFLPFILFLQLTLIPFHIFSTDLLDESTKFSALSIGMRMGAVGIIILTYIVVRNFKLHTDYYYAFTYFVNAMSDAYVSIYSSEGNIVTHFLGFGVVLVAYAVLTALPPLIYNLVMFVSSFTLFGLLYLYSPIPFLSILSNGGAFILFFIVICPFLNIIRYYSLKNDFLSLQELQKLNQDVLNTNEELKQKQEEIATQRDAIEKLYHEISEKNKDITDSIHYAKRIQSKILPTEEIIKISFPEIFILHKPKDIVSGDFYWYNQTQNLGILLAGDCTGHGVPGALMSILAHTALNKVFTEKKCYLPNEILEQTSYEIIQILDQVQNKSSDGFDGSVIAYNKSEKKLILAAANNPILIIKDHEVQEIKSDAMPVGDYQFGENRKYTLHELNTHEPLTIYMFSDGYIDQFGGDKNRKFGKSNFQKLLLDIHQLPMIEQKNILNQHFEEWLNKGNEKQIDDVLVIGIKLF